MMTLGFSAAEICVPVFGKDHNRHVLYTEFLIRYLDGKVTCIPDEEIADAELVRKWIDAEIEHCWEVEKSLKPNPKVSSWRRLTRRAGGA